MKDYIESLINKISETVNEYAAKEEQKAQPILEIDRERLKTDDACCLFIVDKLKEFVAFKEGYESMCESILKGTKLLQMNAEADLKNFLYLKRKNNESAIKRNLFNEKLKPFERVKGYFWR